MGSFFPVQRQDLLAPKRARTWTRKAGVAAAAADTEPQLCCFSYGPPQRVLEPRKEVLCAKGTTSFPCPPSRHRRSLAWLAMMCCASACAKKSQLKIAKSISRRVWRGFFAVDGFDDRFFIFRFFLVIFFSIFRWIGIGLGLRRGAACPLHVCSVLTKSYVLVTLVESTLARIYVIIRCCCCCCGTQLCCCAAADVCF